MKKKWIFLSILTVVFVIMLVLILFLIPKNKIISIKVDEDYNEDIAVLVDNEPVFKKPDNVIIPITMTTVRPITISFGNQTKKIKVKKLSKTEYIPINVIFKNKKLQYNIQTLPEMFPDFTVNNITKQKGYILTSLFGAFNKDASYVLILDTNGNIVYYRGNSVFHRSQFHLKRFVLPDGKIRYATHSQIEEIKNVKYVRGYYIILDEKFNVIDKIKVLQTKRHPEFYADEHDIIVLGDRHYILIGYDKKNTVLKNGQTVEAIHSIIQEQKDGNVIFDWTSEDFPFLMDFCYEKKPGITKYYPDYVHINSIAIDSKDNNLIVSSASGYYIMKINRKTGKIMWIFGGVANQFNIPDGFDFTRQHDAQFLPDGRFILFDNHFIGEDFIAMDIDNKTSFVKIPERTRILLFDLDEQNKKVLSAQKIPLYIDSMFMGSVQQIDADRWLIGCGFSKNCSARMINNSGDVLWEMNTDFDMFKAYYYKNLKKSFQGNLSELIIKK